MKAFSLESVDIFFKTSVANIQYPVNHQNTKQVNKNNKITKDKLNILLQTLENTFTTLLEYIYIEGYLVLKGIGYGIFIGLILRKLLYFGMMLSIGCEKWKYVGT